MFVEPDGQRVYKQNDEPTSGPTDDSCQLTAEVRRAGSPECPTNQAGPKLNRSACKRDCPKPPTGEIETMRVIDRVIRNRADKNNARYP